MLEKSESAALLAPGKFIDSDHPDVVAFALDSAPDDGDEKAKAVALYFAVRDEVRYNPFQDFGDPDTYRASGCLKRGHGYCVAKAALLAAVARVHGIPAKIGFADVKNHLTSPKLREYMGSDRFTYHGYTDLYLGGNWIKATPTFNIELCDKFHVKPLDFDGEQDAIMHPFDAKGREHMEYLRFHGSHADVPINEVQEAMRSGYPKLFKSADDGNALQAATDEEPWGA